MRIIAGKYKRRKLLFPQVKSIRPTMDRVKESMFNMIGDAIEEKDVLHLFAGSGSLGIEALSRGAKSVTFVDQQKIAVDCIKKNINSLPLEGEKTEVFCEDAFGAIQRFQKVGRKFDWIFIDPPYYQGFIKKALMKLEGFDILTRFSYLLLEHSKDEPVPEGAFFTTLKARKFGATCVAICQKSK